jgi:hypothetical protein
MNVQRRLKITSLLVWLKRFRLVRLKLVTMPVLGVGHLARALVQKRIHRSVKELQKGVEAHRATVASYNAEYQSALAEGLTEDRRNHLVALRSALLAESQRLRGRCAELQLPHPFFGSAALILILTGTQRKLLSLQRRNEAFGRILSQIETSETYYWDLLLCVVLPGEYIDEQLGDLNEEYLLRCATEGEIIARAWYCDQVMRSVKDRLLHKIERFVAFGTLIDFAHRWFIRK